MDFTLIVYKELLLALQSQSYSFQPLAEFLLKPNPKSIILRHDVDLLPENSLRFAQLQAALAIKGSYFFRAAQESWDEDIIKEIAMLGHEVGYHYENLTTCNGDFQAAINDFEKNLENLRQLVPVSVICMHGSPASKWDNKDIWEKYDYRDFGIIGEPYFDIDFNKVLYLTDTGRRWDGYKVSVRDKIHNHQESWNEHGLCFHTTNSIIKAAILGKIPDQIMITFHPQRWHKYGVTWYKELLLQNAKNLIKQLIVYRNEK